MKMQETKQKKGIRWHVEMSLLPPKKKRQKKVDLVWSAGMRKREWLERLAKSHRIFVHDGLHELVKRRIGSNV